MSNVSPVSGNSNIFDGSLPNLTAIADDKTAKYTDAQKALARQQRDQREYAAFGRLEAGADVIEDHRALYRAYISYLDSLSPAEQNSSRYAGARAKTVAALTNETKAVAASNTAYDNDRVAQFKKLVAADQSNTSTNANTYSILPSQNLLKSLGDLQTFQIGQQSAAHNIKPLFKIPDLPKLDTSA